MESKQVLQDVVGVLDPLKLKVIAFLPNLLAALGILIFGYIAAHGLRLLTFKLIASLDRMIPSNVAADTLRRIDLRVPASEILSRLVFWILFIFALTVATEVLGLRVVTTWLSGLTTYLPKVVAAVLIAFVGIAAATLSRDLVEKTAAPMGGQTATLLAQVTWFIIALITLLIVVGQLGIDAKILINLSSIAMAGVLLAGAMAFGFGARTVVGNIMASHYLQRSYRNGQRVRIGDTEGVISDISQTAVFLSTAEGTMMIPAKVFLEERSLLVNQED